jgi:hypothetical protein
MQDDETNLRAALHTIRRAIPQAATALFQTSDQDAYGFVLEDVILIDATSLGDSDPTTLEALKDDVGQYIRDMAWDSTMGEDRGGAAAHDVPPPRECFFIPVDAQTEGGFIPSLVTEDRPGHSPMKGNSPFASPWIWGPTYEQALRQADEANARLGISKDEARNIVISSMAATPLTAPVPRSSRLDPGGRAP